jgi:uroporphyrinogen-III decarboxylase
LAAPYGRGKQFVQQRDYQAHNENVERLWNEFRSGNPSRVPVLFMMNPRMIILDPNLSDGVTFEQYIADPLVMMETQLRFQQWRRMNVWADWEMGMPQEKWDAVYVDYQNAGEGAWFGCRIEFSGGMPRCVPLLEDKKDLSHLYIKDPITGHIPQISEAYQFMKDKVAQGWEYAGIPVDGVHPPFLGTDGPFTIAAELRGSTQLCIDLYEDPQFAHDLLDFVTSQTIRRIKAWAQAVGHSFPVDGWYFADDCVEFLSLEHYQEFVLPYHKRLISELSYGKNKIHLCGRVQHLLPTIHRELNIDLFNLGYPTDMGELRQELGPDVELQGNINPMLLHTGTPAAIEQAVNELLGSGVMAGKRFVLCDGHNMVPTTPLENMAAMYEAGVKYGRYR